MPTEHTIDSTRLLALYRTMLTVREIDRAEEKLTSRGEAVFQVSSSGHEAIAALADLLTPADWLHCHYRDKALLLARAYVGRCVFRQPVLQRPVRFGRATNERVFLRPLT